MHPHRCFGWIATLALVPLVGCGALSKAPAGETCPSYRDAALLDAEPPALVVEVDVVEGEATRSRALRIFADRLAFYCDKPDGVEVVVDDTIPPDRWEPTKDAIAALVREFADEARDGAAHLYVLYVPEYKKFRGYSFRRLTLADDVDVPVVVAFTGQLEPILWLTGVRQEASVLVHEFGHVAGLVTDDGHRDGGHCTNGWCLMYDGVDARSLFVFALPTLFTGYLPTHVCRDCREDLWGGERVPGRRAIRGLPSADRPGCDPVWEE